MLIIAAGLGAAACAGDPSRPAAGSPADGLVVASFDFSESQLLAEIYAQALEDEGVAVVRRLGLGPRELVGPALRQGFVDVVPEYAGSALDAARPDAPIDRTDTAAVVDALRRAVVPWGLRVLSPAAASNENAVVVTAELTARYGLTRVSDLAPLAERLSFGGPPECPARPRCLVGLRQQYGLEFETFVPLVGDDLVRRALDDGVIDVGALFTTDAALADGSLVVLADDRRLQPVENVVPVVRATALRDPRVASALDEVSAELTTEGLRFLNWRVEHADTDVAFEARGWLIRHGLVAPT